MLRGNREGWYEFECGFWETKKSFKFSFFRSCSKLRLKTFFVELRGVEPRSKQETHTVSTCLVCLWFSWKGWRRTTNLFLSSLISPANRNLLPTIPVLLVLRMPLPTGSKQWRNIPFRCLAPELSKFYMVKLSCESIISIASYCCEHSDLRAYTQRPACLRTCLTCCQSQFSPGLTPQRYEENRRIRKYENLCCAKRFKMFLPHHSNIEFNC